MQVIHDLTMASLQQETVLTIGAFDGVHRGHQALIRQVVDRARSTGRLAGLITFHPHPALVLAGDKGEPVKSFYLTTPGEKLILLEGLGLNVVALLPFDQELANTSALGFMQLVSRHLRVRELWVGPDFALGREQEGDVPRLQEIGREMGYDVCVLRRVYEAAGEQSVISSSRIRALLREGEVAGVTEMLGRYPAISGEVVPGAHRGRRLGFPTANLEVRAERALPANGVYAVFALLGDVQYQGVANVGVRPSFDNGPRTVETHILDFDADIYGCDLVVEFVARLRDERRFGNVGDLIAQIRQDCAAARSILEAHSRGDLSAASRSDETPDGNGSPACPYWSEEVEHTADRALRVWGRDLADLYVGAARGMVRLMADLDGLLATHWREIRLEALDRETLLVAWLNELLFLTESEGLIFVDCRVKSVTETTLEAWVGGARGEATKAHLKAATFHALEVVRDATGWSTLITFDA
jgi:riboflavin kinase/FMN adenylyltransferase